MPARPGAPIAQLGTAAAVAVIVASMIGTGIFTTTGVLLSTVGSPVWVLGVWAAAGLLALSGAAAYAELGAMMPRAGGEYVYLSRAFGPSVGFIAGWIALIVGFSAPTAAAALAFGRYLHAVVPAAPPRAAALVLLVALTAAHMFDVRQGARLQTALAALVVGLIVAFILGTLGAGRGDWRHLAVPAPGAPPVTAGAVAVALVYVSYAYSGWNGAGYIAGELAAPGRTLPRALALGTGVVTVLYLALNAVYLWAAPAAALAGRVEVAYAAAAAALGAGASRLVSGLVALAVAGCASALLMSGPRVTVAMAEDGLFFRALAARNGRGAPSTAVGLQGALAIVAAATTAFDPILVYVGFTLTLTSAATVLAAFVLRRRAPAAPRPYRALGWPVSGALFLSLSLFMTIFSIGERPRESVGGLITLAAGAGVSLLWRRRRSSSPRAG